MPSTRFQATTAASREEWITAGLQLGSRLLRQLPSAKYRRRADTALYLFSPYTTDAAGRSAPFGSQITFAFCHGVQSAAFVCHSRGLSAVNHKHMTICPLWGKSVPGTCKQVSPSSASSFSSCYTYPLPLCVYLVVIFRLLDLSYSILRSAPAINTDPALNFQRRASGLVPVPKGARRTLRRRTCALSASPVRRILGESYTPAAI